MTTCKINDQSSLEWLYDNNELWKSYVCEQFDSRFVIIGNRDYSEIKDAEWYKNAATLLNDLQNTQFKDLDATDYGISKSKLNKVIQAYKQACNTRFYELPFTKTILEIIYPDDTFKLKTIRGYSQSEWQEVLYKTTDLDEHAIDRLESFYFGQLAEIEIEDEDECITVGCITHDDLWEWERNNTLKKKLTEEYQLPPDAKFFKSDGVITTIKYKEF